MSTLQINSYIKPSMRIVDIKTGGMGIVYIILNEETSEKLAYKTFKDKYYFESNFIKQFRNEAEQWISIPPHPLIVNAHYLENIDNKTFIVMRYVNSINLREWRKKGYIYGKKPKTLLTEPPVGSSKWSDWWHKWLDRGQNEFGLGPLVSTSYFICMALIYMKDHGVLVHRDIKPDNILLDIDQQGLPKLTDLGLAVSSNAGKRNALDGELEFLLSDPRKRVLGCLPYMAPELFNESIQPTVSSDIYAFGIMLYELINGHFPQFVEDLFCQWNMGYNHVINQYEKLPNLIIGSLSEQIPNPLLNIINKCISFNPKDRWNGFDEIQEELGNISINCFSNRIKIHSSYNMDEQSNKDEFYKALCNNAQSLMALGKHKEASPILDSILEINPNDFKVLSAKGDNLTELGLYDEALKYLQRANILNANDGFNLSNIGRVLNLKGNFKEALIYFDKSLTANLRDNERAIVLCNKAIALRNIKRYEDAKACLDESINLWETDLAWHQLALIFNVFEKYNEEYKCWVKITVLNPLNITAWIELGYIHNNNKEFGKARYLFERALKLNGSNISALEGVATTIMLQGMQGEGSEPLEAMAYLDKADLIKPNDKDILAKKAMLYIILDNNKKAIEYFDKAIAQDTNDMKIRKLKESYFPENKLIESDKPIESKEGKMEIDIPVAGILHTISSDEIQHCANLINKLITVTLNGSLPFSQELVNTIFHDINKSVIQTLISQLLVGLKREPQSFFNDKVITILTQLDNMLIC